MKIDRPGAHRKPPGLRWIGRRSRLRLALLLVIALASFRYGHEVLRLALDAPFIDYGNLYTYTTAIRTGADPYDPTQLAGIDAVLRVRHASVPPTVGPAGYLVLAPLTLVPYRVASLLWLGLGQASLVMTLILWTRRLAPTPTLAVVGFFVVFTYQPIIEEVAIGNLNLPVLPLLGLAAVAHARGGTAAVALPLSWAVHLKPQYVLLLPFLYWVGPRLAASLTLGLAAAWAGVALLVFGRGWLDGYVHWLLVGSAGLHAWARNLSPHAMLHRLLGRPEPSPAIEAAAVVLALAVIAAVAWATRDAERRGPEAVLYAWALALAAISLASPLTEEVHLVALLLPLLLVLWRADRLRGRGEVALFVVAAVLLASRYSVERFPLFASGPASLALGGKTLGAAALAVLAARLGRREPDRSAW